MVENKTSIYVTSVAVLFLVMDVGGVEDWGLCPSALSPWGLLISINILVFNYKYLKVNKLFYTNNTCETCMYII